MATINEQSPAQEPARNPDPASPERRAMLTRLIAGLGGVATAIVGLPVLAILFRPVRRIEEEWRAVGPQDDFAVGETVKVVYQDPDRLPWAGFVGESAAYVRREGRDSFVAFSIYCTHTGCPVRWLEGAQQFFCPCHGGSFFRDGSIAAGPPPEPLWRHPVRVRNGQVEIRTIRIPPRT